MEILKDILLEFGFAGSVSVQDITNAVTGMYPAKIVYDDGDGRDGKGTRVICPVAYGISTAGNPVIRAFQMIGSTKSEVPHWKLFKVTNIKSWDTMSGDKYNPEDLVGFNKDGDKQIEIIYSIAPIGNAKDIEITKSQNMPDGLSDTPVTKSDVLNVGKEEDTIDNIDNDEYTANDAINDVLKSANLSNVSKKVDNSSNKQYINNRLEAPETEPVKTSDIPGGENETPEDELTSKTVESPEPVDNEPITKNELNGEDNKLTNTFKDLMSRWENNEDENKEENGD